MSYDISEYTRFEPFLFENQDLSLIGYADAGYLSNPHNDKSKTGFMFLYRGTTIS
jgi:hypothetical protein